MRHGSGGLALWGLGVLAVAGWACETARNPGGIQRDLIPPTISLTVTGSDTQAIASGLSFSVDAADNLGLKEIQLTYTGGFIFQSDTVFTSTVTSVTMSVHVTFPSNSGAGGLIRIVGRATDGAGNSAADTIFIVLSNVQALKVFLLAPAPGAVASAGKAIPVQVVAVQASGIRKIGFQFSPAGALSNPTVPPNDSILFTAPFADSVVYTDSLTVLALTGTFTLVGFAEDSAGRRGTSNTVTVSILSAANDTSPPLVSFTIASRVEVTDSITVHATDPSGIAWIGFRVRDSVGTVLRFDTVNVAAGNLTDVTRTFSLNLAGLITTFPARVVVDGYACDAAVARNCAFSQTSTVIQTSALASGAALVQRAAAAVGTDTIIVVAGVTRPLPLGGRIADAIFNPNDSTLYLTNPTLSRVEIFQVANTSFVASGIRTAGPQPWGIALWPRDTLGNVGDTIVVANAGGTELSVIDVRPGVRRLAWRQDLPNFIVQKYNVQQVVGGFQAKVTEFDLSDRPQYLGTVCRPAGGTACSADSIFALYSTTPTQSSTSPFNGRGTLRMEKLINTQDTSRLFGHLFWEIGNAGSAGTTDTLRLILRRGLPYNQTKVVLSACAGVTIDFQTFGLGDSTFARNSGNFTHGFFGEGGIAPAPFRRVMLYTTKNSLRHGAPTAVSCFTSPAGSLGPSDAGDNDVDFGMSPGVDVRDFISNTGVRVSAIAINFNGATNLVRADSIYYLDEGLRLKGTSCTLSSDLTTCVTGAPGMDMNYFHDFAAGQPGTPAFGGTRDSTNRVAFAARPDANIDVFDTFFYGKIASIPVRDPIIGPLRVAKNASGNQLLFGVTTRGLVMVRLPSIPNPNPAPRLRSP